MISLFYSLVSLLFFNSFLEAAIPESALTWNFYGVTYQEFMSIIPRGFLNVTLAVNESKLPKADINMPPLVLINTNTLVQDGWNIAAGNLTMISYDKRKKIRTYATSIGFNAPDTIGVHYLQWSNGKVTSDRITLEITCSDGIICNGEERYVYVQDPSSKEMSMKCMSTARSLCDDENDCTTDTCNESSGMCNFVIDPTVPEKKCPKCFGGKCVPKCAKKNCGPDSCGGFCGPDCSGPGEFCIAGQCKVENSPGMCNNPYNITSEIAAADYKGIFTYFGDTSKGNDILRPKCNALSTAGEIIYHFTVPKNHVPVGIDARVLSASGDPSRLDTVLQLIEINPAIYPNTADGCFASNKLPQLAVACTDDSSPPGSYSSRVTWVLKPGFAYYVHVDGFSSKDEGKYKLTLTLTPECSMRCDGKVCGDSGCGPDFTCGTCKSGFECSTDGSRCYKAPCKPNCKGRSCGDDGCGGTCGSCDEEKGFLCSPPKGKCLQVGVCDNFKPKCSHKVKVGKKIETYEGCADNQYCGVDCQCYDLDADMMDLFVDLSQMNQAYVVDNYFVDKTSCSYQEKCFTETGMRKIFRFPTNVGNQGRNSFNPAYPPESRPDLFVWGACHGHWHFDGFAEFYLMSKDLKTVIAVGGKRSYCAEDSYQMIKYPYAPCLQQYDCDKQGISRGWIDIYSQELDCQFVDITDVPPGEYVLKQCTNVKRTYEEASRGNNCAYHKVKL